MKCRAVRREIEEIEAGQAYTAQADAHLLVCAACRRFAIERASLKALMGGLEQVSAPPDFDWRLRARLMEARTESAPRRRWFAGFAPGTQALALAATFVFLIAGVVVYRQMRSVPSLEGETSSRAAVAEKGVTESGKALRQGSADQPTAVAASSPEATEPKSKETARPRSHNNNGRGGASRLESAKVAPASERIYSNDFGSRPATELTASDMTSSFTGAGPVVPVPLRYSNATRLQFEDGEGTKRSLAPVIFGGQESIERKDAVRPVSTGNKGVW